MRVLVTEQVARLVGDVAGEFAPVFVGRAGRRRDHVAEDEGDVRGILVPLVDLLREAVERTIRGERGAAAPYVDRRLRQFRRGLLRAEADAGSSECLLERVEQ